MTTTGARIEANEAALPTLIEQFLAGELPKAEWTHEAHLRVGLWHLLNFAPDVAMSRLREGILRLNAAHGTPNTDRSGYHETITQFYVWVIHDFVAHCDRRRPFDELAAELVASHGIRDLPLRFYTRERLNTPEARRHVVLPDLPPANGWPAYLLERDKSSET